MRVRFLLLTYNPYSKPEWEHLDEFIWAVCIVAGIVVVVGIVWRLFGRSEADDRQDDLESLAVQLGLRYSTQGTPGVSEIIDKATSLVKVESAVGYNVLHGDSCGRHLLAFDFGYSNRHEMEDWYRAPIGEIKSFLTFVASGAAVPFEWEGAGAVIRPRGMVGRFLGGVTDERPDFVPRAFNREYSVDCRDRELLRSLLSEAMCDYLIRNRGWTTELCSAGLVVSGKGEWTMDEFRSALEFLAGLVERLPGELEEAAGAGRLSRDGTMFGESGR